MEAKVMGENHIPEGGRLLFTSSATQEVYDVIRSKTSKGWSCFSNNN